MYASVVFDIALDREFDYIVPLALEGAVAPGFRVKAPFGFRLATGIVTELKQTSSVKAGLKEIKQVLDNEPQYGKDLFSLASYIKQTWGGSYGQILFSLIPFFVKKQHDVIFQEIPAVKQIELNETQQSVFGDLKNSAGPSLLFAPPKTGKKSILIKLALEAAQKGQVLIMLPDILSAQVFAADLQRYYGKRVLLWHSKLLDSVKKQLFSSLLHGKNGIVIGTRSAVLLPLVKPSLIAVVNEESADFKQEENRPFYHARGIALFRAKELNAKLLFLSQTPSLEMLEFVSKGEIKKFTLSQNQNLVNPFPLVSVTDKKAGKKSFLPDITFDEITKSVKNKETVLLILNNKGGKPLYSCLNCGLAAVCGKCGGTLVFDESGGLACVKCGKEAPLEQKCPKCSNVIFKPKISGNQKVYGEIKKLFPSADTVKQEKMEIGITPAKDKANIIIGTSAVLKMLSEQNFPADLIVFLDADMELNSPDFRAGEHLAQLLFGAKQMLLGSKNGRMVIACEKAEAAIFNAAVHGDYGEFAQNELEFREAFNFPPYATLTKLVLSSKNIEDINQSVKLVKEACQNKAEILGPIRFGKKTDSLKKEYLLFKNFTLPALQDLLASVKLPKTVKIKIAVDPYTFF